MKQNYVLIDFSLTVKVATLIFISGRGSAISSAKEGKSDFIYHLVKSYNPFLVYCRELAPGTVSLTGDRAQGDDSKHDSHYNQVFEPRKRACI